MVVHLRNPLSFRAEPRDLAGDTDYFPSSRRPGEGYARQGV